MEFIVDKVSEDSFYENLLIGLPKILEKLPNVGEVNLERSPPVPHSVICTWEQKNGVLLPEDLRSFYASTNGLLYTYNITWQDDADDKLFGRIHINSLNDLVQIYGYEIQPNPGINTDCDRYQLKLGAESKVFELVNLYDIGRVSLIYLHHRYLPTIWMHDSELKFYYLSDDFTTYLKMCIHHLGIPLWEFSFTPDGTPEWSEMIFRLLAPAILPAHKKIENIRKNNQQKLNDHHDDLPINKIDSNIIKTTRLPQTNEITSIDNINRQSKRKQAKIITKKSVHQKK